MTKEEAIQSLKAGNKITHDYFTDEEYMWLNKQGLLQFEDNVECTIEEFFKYRQLEGWAEGYSIYQSKT